MIERLLIVLGTFAGLCAVVALTSTYCLDCAPESLQDFYPLASTISTITIE